MKGAVVGIVENLNSANEYLLKNISKLKRIDLNDLKEPYACVFETFNRSKLLCKKTDALC